MRFGTFVLAALALCATATGGAAAPETNASPAPPSTPPLGPKSPSQAQNPFDIPFTKYTLGNGLEVILHQDVHLPMVTVNVWYHVGPVNEPPQRSGFAHLFEHLMFEGSKYVGDRFDTLLESAGGTNMNGTTNWDRTNYYETVPGEQLELALWLEADRMGFMIDTLTQEKLDLQREVVKNERRQSYENQPYGPSTLKLYDLLFPEGHPYHGAVIGSMEDLSRATLADVQAFFQKYYSPSNATLVIAGNFDAKKARAMVDKFFGTLPARGNPTHKSGPWATAFDKPLPKLALPAEAMVLEEVTLPQVVCAWIVPPAYSASEPALDLAARILTQGKASRLYQALVARGIANSVGASMDANQVQSTFELQARAASGHTSRELIDELERQVLGLAQIAPRPEELARAKTALKVEVASLLQRLNSDGGESGRAGMLQRMNHYLGDPGALTHWMAAYDAVTPEQITAAVASFLPAEKRTLVITEPGVRVAPKDAPSAAPPAAGSTSASPASPNPTSPSPAPSSAPPAPPATANTANTANTTNTAKETK
jgi:predicted Zn-dependent peptidase